MTQRTHWRSLTAAAAPIEVAEDGTWSGPITWTNTWSADGRQLATLDGEIPTRPLPLPVAVQWHLAQGHDGAEVGLARLDEVWQDGNAVWGRGVIDMEDPRGPELARKIRNGFLRFASADVDDVEMRAVAIGPDGEVLDSEPTEGGTVGELWTRWRIMGVTLLAHPAFPGAHIAVAPTTPAPEPEVVAEPVEVELTAAAELAEDDEGDGQEQDGPVAAGLVIKAADTGRVLMLQRSLDDDDDPAAGRWEFPGGGIEDGEEPLRAALREWQEETGATLPEDLLISDGWISENGVYAGFIAVVPTEDTIAINTDHEDRQVLNPDDPDGDHIEVVAWWDPAELPGMPALREEVRATPWHLIAEAGIAEEPDDGPADDVPDGELGGALTAAAFRLDGWTPPAAWFADPQLPGPQPITVDDDGRVSGHLAAWHVPHRSYPGRDITAPRSSTGYAAFNSRPVATADGLVDVGLITMDTGHAGLQLGRSQAARHYDDTGTMAAVVRAGEDAHGIWLAGAVLPWLTDEQRMRLSLSRFSGDWRSEGGAAMELVAALAVNTEGFPVPSGPSGDREEYALIAAGALPSSQQTARVTAALDAGRRLRTWQAARSIRSPRILALAASAGDPADQEDDLPPLDDIEPDPEAIAEALNWVDDVGGLPRYIRRIADHLMREGRTESHAIAIAVNAVKRWCRGGGNVKADTRAKACAAVASWEAKRARARAS
ncbi:NUDIX domain-containing protein [Streptomyces xiamenensis]|uniref:NUDIX hydrolase n=1 Tax=Streptomyces xiamenensis TaxID=408015 RepID=UPI003D711AFC